MDGDPGRILIRAPAGLAEMASDFHPGLVPSRRAVSITLFGAGAALGRTSRQFRYRQGPEPAWRAVSTLILGHPSRFGAWWLLTYLRFGGTSGYSYAMPTRNGSMHVTNLGDRTHQRAYP